MKIGKIIMGCALAAGLMTVAASKAQAGVIIDNELFAPLNIKVTYSYINDHGKVKKVSVTQKDILAYFEAPKHAQLALDVERYDVVIIGNDGDGLEEWYDLEDAGIFGVETEQATGTETAWGDTGFKLTSQGYIWLGFYSNGNSLGSNDYDFEVAGTYTAKYSESDVNHHDQKSVSGSASFKNLVGTGYNFDVSDYELPVAGGGSGSGSGKIDVVL